MAVRSQTLPYLPSLSHVPTPFPLVRSTSIVTVAAAAVVDCTRDNEAALLPNFAMCELRIVSRTVFTGRRNYHPGLKWPWPSALPSLSSSTSFSHATAVPHRRRRRGRRGTREDGFPLLKYGRGVSNVITLDSCLLCSSTTKSYSALTSKAKLPSGLSLPPSHRSLARASAPFFPFFTL